MNSSTPPGRLCWGYPSGGSRSLRSVASRSAPALRAACGRLSRFTRLTTGYDPLSLRDSESEDWLSGNHVGGTPGIPVRSLPWALEGRTLRAGDNVTHFLARSAGEAGCRALNEHIFYGLQNRIWVCFLTSDSLPGQPKIPLTSRYKEWLFFGG
jgi:hypothetical protein